MTFRTWTLNQKNNSTMRMIFSRLVLAALFSIGLRAAAQGYLALHEKAIVVDTHNEIGRAHV